MKRQIAFHLVAFCFAVSVCAGPPAPASKVRIIKTPFRLKFQSYNGDPENPAGMTFEINLQDIKLSNSHFKLGDTVPRTKLKLAGFKYRMISLPNLSKPVNASELSLINIETNKQTTMVLFGVLDIPIVHRIPLASNGSPLNEREATREKMLLQIGRQFGRQVAVTGTVNLVTKFGRRIEFGGAGVDLEGDEAALRRLVHGSTVRAVGFLRYEAAIFPRSPLISPVPERFILDVSQGHITAADENAGIR